VTAIDASQNPIASRRFDEFIHDPQIVIEPVTEAQARVAREGSPIQCSRTASSPGAAIASASNLYFT
jgi:hypothetical protein